MLQKIKNALSRMASSTLNKTLGLVPGRWITLITLLFDGYALYSGGLLGIGAISGIALCFSVLFILLATNVTVRDWVCKLITYYGAIGDIIMTSLLTYFGFQSGPTLGMVGLFLGMNISAMFAIIRWAYFLNRPEEKVNFEASKKQPKAKSRISNSGGFVMTGV